MASGIRRYSARLKRAVHAGSSPLLFFDPNSDSSNYLILLPVRPVGLINRIEIRIIKETAPTQ